MSASSHSQCSDRQMAQPWILIPAHNRRAMTLGCLRHLEQDPAFGNCRVLVVDDGSSDGTAAAIRSEFPQVGLLGGSGDLYWTGAIRAGMAEADRNGASSVIWLNDDCLPEKGSLATLMQRCQGGTPALVGATCTAAEDSRPVTTAFIGRLAVSEVSGAHHDMPVDGLSGFCVALPRAVWETIGFPDAGRFPHYYGDTAYCLCARRAGFDILLSSQCRAKLVNYRERPRSIRALLASQSVPRTWEGVFRSPKSPFRTGTQWHYLRLRYGALAGTLLACYRIVSWQLKYASTRRS